MASVMGLLKARETDARVRVEELRAEADRVLPTGWRPGCGTRPLYLETIRWGLERGLVCR